MEQKICPRCGKPNPPDAVYCQYCGYPLQGAGGESTALAVSGAGQPTAGGGGSHTLRLSEEEAAGGSGTQVFGFSIQQPRQHQQPARPVAQQPQVVHIGEPPSCSGSPLPAPYYLVFPDGRILVRYSQMCVYGREDFEAFIPREYARFITRRSKGGQFTIYCEIKDVNTVVCYIRDDFSTNPTLVNGVPIKGKGAIRLNDGDIISPAGIVNLRFNYASPPKS